MKYSIRQRVINQYGLPVVKIEQVTGELGSKIPDKNGNEIFEGDILVNGDREEFEVLFVDGKFMANPYDYHNSWLPLIEVADMLEIVGHVEDITSC